MTLAANTAVTSAQADRVLATLHAAGIIPNGQLYQTISNRISDALSGTPAQQTAAAIWLTAVLPKLRDFLTAMAGDVPNAGIAATDLTAMIANL